MPRRRLANLSLSAIRRITELRPIPSTSQFQMAIIDGWTCAVRTGAFTKGEPLLILEIDSFVPAPAADPRFTLPLHAGVTT
ncbi:hypothetical protein F4821DRAFT_231423 [Hypoxylon rubiginosum]|uniref:Uncharacterized protein n=1 Tax=Hypoxylon rubiginosum TaxID=110542 RepID=A0ACC0D974_9PEZI|nr:hypothetical protein F4821DRAFT_231423 [Hypoxylon rubiginosum]